MENSISKQQIKQSVTDMGSGYDSKLDLHYDSKWMIGKTTVFVVNPEIANEENQQRIQEVEDIIGSIYCCKATIIKK